MWIKIQSHRARDKAHKAGIKYLELVNWPSMDHYCITYDKNREMAARIKGISILKNRPKGTFTKCWG